MKIESRTRTARLPEKRRSRTPSLRRAAVPVVVFAEPLAGRLLRLGFADGCEGEVDVAALIGSFRGVFAPLRRQSYFRRVRVDPGLGTVCWPNGADISPEFLWDRVRFEKLGIHPPRSYVNGFPHSKPPTPRQLRAWREEDRAMSTGTPRRAARRKRRARK